MKSMQARRIWKTYAVLVIAGVLGVQLLMIIPIGEKHKSWYWPFLNYPMYSIPHYPGDQYIRFELWASPVHEPERLRLVPHRDLHLTAFKYHTILKTAAGNDRSVASGSDESASELIARIATEHMSGQPLRLQIWRQTWTLGASGLEDRAGVRELRRDWSPACEFGPTVSRCTSEVP